MAVLSTYSPLSGGNSLVGGSLPNQDPWAAGLGGPNLTTMMGGPPSLTAVPGPQGGVPTTFGADVTSGQTPPPSPPPDPASDAAEKAAADMDKIQQGLLDAEKKALSTEQAMGAKLGDWQNYMARAMQPFQPPKQTSPFQGWGAAAMVFAGIGSLLTRQPLTTAFNAMAGVIKATREGDQKALDNSMEIWKANSEQALKLGDFEMQAYRTALEGVHTQIDLEKEISEAQMNETMAKVMATSSALNDQSTANIFLRQGVPAGVDWLLKKVNAQAKFAEESNKFEEQVAISKAVKEFLASPEAQQMTAQQRADRIKMIQNPSVASGDLTSEALQQAAEQEVRGDHSWKTNVGRGIQGSANITAVMNQAAAIRASQGQGGADATAADLGFLAEKSAAARSGARIAQVTIAANEAQGMRRLALEQSKKVPRGEFFHVNELTLALETESDNPDVLQFVAYTNSFIQMYARVVSPTGVPTDNLRSHIYAVLSTAQSPDGYKKVMEALGNDIGIAQAAPQDFMNKMWRDITGHDAPQNVGGTGGEGGGGVAGGGDETAPTGKLPPGTYDWQPNGKVTPQ